MTRLECLHYHPSHVGSEPIMDVGLKKGEIACKSNAGVSSNDKRVAG